VHVDKSESKFRLEYLVFESEELDGTEQNVDPGPTGAVVCNDHTIYASHKYG